MKKLFLLMSLSLLASAAKAQLTDWVPGSASQLEYVILPDAKDNIVGSPYYEDEFTPGVIMMEGKESLRAYLRYNVVDDQVEVRVAPNAESTYVLPKDQSISYKLKNYVYKLRRVTTDEGIGIEGYFMDYYSGEKASFYAKPTARVIRPRRESTAFNDRTSLRRDVFIDYYLVLENRPLIHVKLKEKDFRKVLEDAPGMKEYFSENKIKDEADVVRMLRYYEAQQQA